MSSDRYDSEHWTQACGIVDVLPAEPGEYEFGMVEHIAHALKMPTDTNRHAARAALRALGFDFMDYRFMHLDLAISSRRERASR